MFLRSETQEGYIEELSTCFYLDTSILKSYESVSVLKKIIDKRQTGKGQTNKKYRLTKRKKTDRVKDIQTKRQTWRKKQKE